MLSFSPSCTKSAVPLNLSTLNCSFTFCIAFSWVLTMAKLFEELSDYLESPSVLRRMLFAVVNLSRDLPDYCTIVRNFGISGADDKSLTSTKVKALVENLQYLDKDLFLSDKNLMELLMKEQGRDGKAIGIALI